MSTFDFSRQKWAIFYCAVSTLGALCYGYDQIYYTGVLGMRAFIRDYGTTRDLTTGSPALTTTFISLTSSIIYIGEFAGALLAAPINERRGRKAVFLSASLSIIAGAVVQCVGRGPGMAMLVAGRVLIGLGIGQFTVSCLLYVGEVAPPGLRGPALMSFQLLQSLSQLAGSGVTRATEAVASSAAYRMPMALLALLPAAMLLALPFIPESPAWCVRRGALDRAAAALARIRRGGDGDGDGDAAAELARLRAAVAAERAEAEGSSWRALVADGVERRKLVFACGAMVAQQVNGIQFFYSYGVVFAQSIGMADPFTVSLVTNVLQVVAVVASVLLAGRVRRRANLLATTAVMLLALVVVGALASGGRKDHLTAGYSTAIVVCSYVVIVAFNFGHGPLAYTIASEMATGRNRNKIMSCAIGCFFTTIWLIAFTSPYLYYDAHLGPMLGFVYAGTTCITLAYVWFCVGETAGRSNHEIELFFQRGIPVRQWRSHQFGDDGDGKADLTKEPPVERAESV